LVESESSEDNLRMFETVASEVVWGAIHVEGEVRNGLNFRFLREETGLTTMYMAPSKGVYTPLRTYIVQIQDNKIKLVLTAIAISSVMRENNLVYFSTSLPLQPYGQPKPTNLNE
jgi:hypothetical protein